MQVMRNLADFACTTPQLAALLRVSAQHLGTLEKKGIIKRAAPNRWPLAEAIQHFVTHQREARKYDSSDALKTVRELQAEKLRMANAVRARELIPVAEAETVL